MSKNTGTSELINYFDLGANGDVGIAGSLDVNTIANADTDTDKFLVSDTGIIKYRTGAELLSDIGGQGALTNPITGTGTSGTIPVFTGSTTIGNSILQSNSTQVNIVGNGSQLLFDSLSASKSGGIQYTNDFELLINNSRGTGSAIYLGNTNLDFHTNVSGNPRLRITDGGNVLIGTTTDNGLRLQVSGDIYASNEMYLDNGKYLRFKRSSGGLFIQTLGIDSGTDNVRLLTTGDLNIVNGSLTNLMTVKNGGNVGIGTTSPGQRLSVFQDTNGDARLSLTNPNTGVSARTFLYTITTGNRYVGMLAYGANATGTTVGLSNASLGILEAGGDISNFLINSTNPMVFGVNGSERMRINSNGFLKASNNGVFYDSASSYHELMSNQANNIAYLWNTSANPYGPYMRFSAAAPNNGTNYYLYFDDTSAARFIVYSNGGISNYQANNTNLSDERTKKEIAPLESYWDKFKNIEIVKFKYKDQTHDDFNIGVIAQQVEKVAPEFVDVDGWNNKTEGNEVVSQEEPIKSIYTADLHHATIKVLQEAMAKIEKLETEIDKLKNV
jgi:hypothetical protein